MRIALVTERFDPARGGAERSAWELTHHLAAAGHDVTVVTRRLDAEPEAPRGFTLRIVDAKGPTRTAQWRHFAQAARRATQQGYDLVHSLAPLVWADVYQPRGGSILHGARRHAASYACPLLSRLKSALGCLNRARQGRIAAERRLCHTPDGPLVLALSDYVADQFRRLYGLDGRRLRVVRGGIDVAPLRHDQAVREGHTLRQRLDPQGDLTLFLFAAENLRLKGLPELLHAAARVRQGPGPATLVPDFRLLVTSHENFAPYYRLAEKLGLDRRVIFLGATQAMPVLLHACDAVVLPTHNDACSRLVLEALAAGKPALTTRFNGAAEFLREGAYGHVIDAPARLLELADALRRLCRPEHRQTLAAAIARDRLWQQVSLTRHVEELQVVYRTLVRSRRPLSQSAPDS